MATAAGAPTVLWTIGQQDQSGREFGLERHFDRFSKEVPADFSFQAGKDAAVKWPYIHPGPVDRWAGEKTHTLKIRFDLPAVPKGQCAVVVNSLGSYAGAQEKMQASINGNTTVTPVPRGPGDEALYDESKGKPGSTRVEFFPEMLRAGSNEIALTIVDGAWMLYDNVQLEVDESKSAVRFSDLKFEQTPCLTTGTASGLQQVIRGTVINHGPPVNASIRTGVAGKQNTTQSGAGSQLKFGGNSFDVLVPAAEQNTTVTIEFAADGPGAEPIRTEVAISPQRKWKIFVQPSIHTDIGYTHRQIDVFHRHNANLDKVMEMCQRNPLFKWSIEVAWEVQNYFNDRPTTAQQELISLMKQGRLGLNAGYLNMLTALMSDEAMNHYAYYAAGLRRNYGIDVSTSLMTDIPSATRGLASAMAASGVPYFSEGCNQDRGPVLRHSGIRAPFYWEGPDGSRVLTWLSEGYAQSAWLAQSQDLDTMYENVAGVVRGHERKGAEYPYDAAYLYGAFLDNWEVDTRYGDLLKEWNARYAYPQIIVSRGPEFFEYLEKHFAKKIEVRAKDFGAFWEDGAGSTQKETTIHMENQRRITTAETLWSLAKLAGATESYPYERFQKAWEDIIFYAEHTWGAAQSISSPDDPMTIDQWNTKAEYAHRPDSETRDLQKAGLEAYLKAVPSKRGELVVFNPCSWTRSGPVELPAGFIRDPRNGHVQRLERRAGETESTTTLFRDYIYAEDVPALGTKIISTDLARPDATVTGQDVRLHALENAFYRIELSTTSGISSIVDKETGAELLNRASPYSFGQLVYASGGEGTRMIHPDQGPFADVVANTNTARALTPPKGTVYLTAANVTFVQPEPNAGPICQEAVVRSATPAMQHMTMYVRLHNRQKRISLDVHFHGKKEIRTKEAVYIAFPFAGSDPKFRLGMSNAIQRPEKDFAHGACHEWYCVQDFVACADEKRGTEIIWASPDVPLVCLGNVNRGRWPADPELTTPTIFSYAMNNYWHTNYKAGQGGDFLFRYDITSGKAGFTNEQCLRFARDTAVPMLAAVSPGGTAREDAPQVNVTGNGVIVGTIKAAEDGNGMVVRLRNAQETPTTARVRVRGSSTIRAELLNLVEDSTSSPLQQTNGEFAVPMKPQQVATVRLY